MSRICRNSTLFNLYKWEYKVKKKRKELKKNGYRLKLKYMFYIKKENIISL